MPGVKGRSGGHNRKTIAELKLTGAYRPGRHGGLADSPPAAPPMVPKPTRLSIGAAGVWDALAPLATAMGTLTQADVMAFSTMCELQGTFERATAAKDAGVPLASVSKLERDTAAALRPFYAAFGFTPEGRARLHLTPVATPRVNPLDRFLARKQWPELP